MRVQILYHLGPTYPLAAKEPFGGSVVLGRMTNSTGSPMVFPSFMADT